MRSMLRLLLLASGIAVASGLALPPPAFAQEAPTLVPTAGGLVVTGSVVVDGVEYPAEQLQALLDAFRADPSSLTADLPLAVRMAVYDLAGGGA